MVRRSTTRRRRDELLDRSIQYLLDRGIADLSLRPLARAVGTSARLLIYHFGSKEQLLVDAMTELRRRLQETFAAVAVDADPFAAFWRWAMKPASLKCLSLLFEVQTLAIRRPAQYRMYL